MTYTYEQLPDRTWRATVTSEDGQRSATAEGATKSHAAGKATAKLRGRASNGDADLAQELAAADGDD